jgi:hypothetical protein
MPQHIRDNRWFKPVACEATLVLRREEMKSTMSARRTFFEGLGLSVLAFGFSGMLSYAALVAAAHADYARAAAFGIPGAIALYWSVRFLRAQLAAYRAEAGGSRRDS